MKATTTPLQTSRSTPHTKEASGGTSNRLGAQAPRVTSQRGRNVAGNVIWFGQVVDRVLLSQSPKFQKVWVEGLRVLSKMGCSNGGAHQDIRVEGWRWKKGLFIVFMGWWGFLPVGPRAHGLSQPRAHGVPRELRSTLCARGSKDPVRTGYPITYCCNFLSTTAHTLSSFEVVGVGRVRE